MYDYSRLPSLVPVMDRICGYLHVRDRARCKCVCRSWREEIELREKKSDTLVLHVGSFNWNMRWGYTNNRGLMRYEHSFGLNQLTSLKHPLTRLLLKRIKKLAVISFHRNASQMEPISSAQIGYFDQCEEIELQNLEHENPLIFNLPKLRVLTIRENSVDKLVLNCPSLEVLFCNWKVDEIDLRNAKKLKRLICFSWPEKVLLDGKLDCLEYTSTCSLPNTNR